MMAVPEVKKSINSHTEIRGNHKICCTKIQLFPVSSEQFWTKKWHIPDIVVQASRFPHAQYTGTACPGLGQAKLGQFLMFDSVLRKLHYLELKALAETATTVHYATVLTTN